MIIRGFCLSTGTNLTLSYSRHTFRHSLIAIHTSATGCLKIVMSCLSEISLALAFISETESYKGYSFLWGCWWTSGCSCWSLLQAHPTRRSEAAGRSSWSSKRYSISAAPYPRHLFGRTPSAPGTGCECGHHCSAMAACPARSWALLRQLRPFASSSTNGLRSISLLRAHLNIIAARISSKARGRQRYRLWIDWEAVWCISPYRHLLGYRRKGFWICTITPLRASTFLPSTLLASSIWQSEPTIFGLAHALSSTTTPLPRWWHRIPHWARVPYALPLPPFFSFLPLRPICPREGGP